MNNLPNGAIVKLKGVSNSFLIIARLPLLEQNDETVYFDYQAALLPQGIAEENSAFFNQEDIDFVIFPGLAGDDTAKFEEGVQNWLKNNHEIKQGVIENDADDTIEPETEELNSIDTPVSTGPYGF